jgi:hypothetical protein
LDDSKLFAEMRAALAAYRKVEAVYDAELIAAYECPHGTLKFMEHIKAANDMGPKVLAALGRYQSAVRKIFELYNQKITR